jgi:hypothetical protein
MFYNDDQDRLWLWAVQVFFNTTGFPTITAGQLVEMLTLMDENHNGQVSPIAAGMFLKRSGAFRRIRGHSYNKWRPTRRFKSLLHEELSRR